MTGTESGEVTGTKDKDYNLIWFTEACLSNALRLETRSPSDRSGGSTTSTTGSSSLARTATRYRSTT